MSTQVDRAHDLAVLGIVRSGPVQWNLSAPAIYEEAVRGGEGVIAAEGPLVCRTGSHTGRSPNDKFIVREPLSASHIGWGKVKKAMEQAQCDARRPDFTAARAGEELYALDCYAGDYPTSRLPVRIITEYAWHSLFCR